MIIRAATARDNDAIARVWMESWASVGIEPASDAVFARLRARIPHEIKNGWSLHVVEDNAHIVAMLAFRPRDAYLDQLFVAPDYQGRGVGRMLLGFTRKNLPDEIWLWCASANEKAWRWYEREGFVMEEEAEHPSLGFMTRRYRWRR